MRCIQIGYRRESWLDLLEITDVNGVLHNAKAHNDDLTIVVTNVLVRPGACTVGGKHMAEKGNTNAHREGEKEGRNAGVWGGDPPSDDPRG